MAFKWRVTGSKMIEVVYIETEGKTALQALFKAQKEANRLNLDWEEIEYV